MKAVGVAGTLGVVGVGTASARPPRDGDTIVDVAIAVNSSGPFAGQFDTLIAAVLEAGLAGALSGNRQLTVFAPTDEAFKTLGITPDNVDTLDDEFLTDVLLYHVVPGRRRERSIVNTRGVPTLNGARVAVDGTSLNDGQANIIVTDIAASTGFVHAIDGVLQP